MFRPKIVTCKAQRVKSRREEKTQRVKEAQHDVQLPLLILIVFISPNSGR